LGDVTELKLADLERWIGPGKQGIDLMVGGSPCQDLSRLGQSAGIEKGQRSSLFFEYVRILREAKPRWFLFENVVMAPKDAEIVTKELGVLPVIIDAADLGPGRRKRQYWTNIPVRKMPPSLMDRPMTAQEVILDDACAEDEKAYCITRWYRNGRKRSYHCLEVERIMGFPDFYTADVDQRIIRWGLLGNSFSVYVVNHIFSSLFKGDTPFPDLHWERKAPAPTRTVELVSPPDSGPAAIRPICATPRLTIGEREKCRRILRRLEKILPVDDGAGIP
ncbi:S-adenosyl-L-methionine-dependent methyltransferase, partial [Blyttiomyces helicus]